MTKLEKLLQDLDETAIHEMIVWEACSERGYLPWELVINLIEAAEAHRFTVIFQKTNGDIREMVCLRDVEKAKDKPVTSDLVMVWDIEATAIRCFNIRRVFEFTIDR